MTEPPLNNQLIESWPIFICYRQVDGKAAARRLHLVLDKWQTRVPADAHKPERTAQLDVYLDENMPGVGDWTQIHGPYLQKARAFILVCTPGSALNEGDGDWVHLEIDTWLKKNPDVSPIIVDPLNAGSRFIPKQVARCWPDIQRIPLIEEEWQNLSEAVLEQKRAGLRAQILGAILPSGTAVYEQELRKERDRARRLAVANVVSVLLLTLASIAILMVRSARDNAKHAESRAEFRAKTARASELAAYSNTNRETDHGLSLLLAVASVDTQETPQGYQALICALTHIPWLERYVSGHQDSLPEYRAAAISPTGKYLARTSNYLEWHRSHEGGAELGPCDIVPSVSL